MTELWKAISGYEGLYEVSTFGRIRRVKHFSNRKPLILKSGIGSKYHQVSLCNDGEVAVRRVHRLVAEAFLEKVVGKEMINHKNGIKSDNRIENLEWCTAAENSKHAVETGLKKYKRGKWHGRSKLTEEQVLEIRRLYVPHKYGHGMRKISKKYGITPENVYAIIKRRTWAFL